MFDVQQVAATLPSRRLRLLGQFKTVANAGEAASNTTNSNVSEIADYARAFESLKSLVQTLRAV